MSNLLTIKEAADYLNVHPDTLRKWDKSDKLKPVVTSGGHRRYQQETLDEYIGIHTKTEVKKEVTATYSRVSSHEQKTKGDLDRQSSRLSEFCANKKFNVEYIIKDVGSGLSDTRSGFLKLTKLVIEGKITNIVIENKDRLTRFQYNFVVKMFDSYGVNVICVNKPDEKEDNEFVNDLMMIIASFSGRLYGSRSAKLRKEAKQKKVNISE